MKIKLYALVLMMSGSFIGLNGSNPNMGIDDANQALDALEQDATKALQSAQENMANAFTALSKINFITEIAKKLKLDNALQRRPAILGLIFTLNAQDKQAVISYLTTLISNPRLLDGLKTKNDELQGYIDRIQASLQ